MNYRLSNYLIITDIIDEGEVESDNSHRIVYATRSGMVLRMKDSMLRALKEGHFHDIDHQQMIDLMHLGVIVPSQEDEFDVLLQQNVHMVKAEKDLNITIQPTANCQLGCHYCGQQHSKHTIADDVIQKVLHRIDNKMISGKYESISVQWYGGEPLMAYNQIVSTSKQLIEKAAEKGITYYANMITNGLSFKKNVFLKLVTECKITDFQITLDGTAISHDKRRITKTGESTFDIIFSNILDAINTPEYDTHDVGIVLRMNIDKTNEAYINDLIDMLAEHGFHKKKVKLDFVPIVNWGDKTSGTDDGLDKDSFAIQEIDWMMYAMEKGFKHNKFVPGRYYAPCMVVKDDSEVYDAYGNIYPCYEFPYTPRFENDNYRIGNVAFPEETYNKDAITRNWNTDIKTGISFCPSCKLFPVCGGGCPKQWYSKEIACPSFKHNIEDRLVLEYLANKDGKNIFDVLQKTS
ncbi:MAG: SPASM domain-containing protein [Chitinophaga sp.]|uniref:radical SAM protein n=1 Tax=Chitinophaga sp. TaxID=1869181 RepID=UPI0025C5FF64|nr:radical SAM protein [Chitinophaga sp.]MBV8254762.1 SPASM domain-containing protein [Chitinophaga sp.]